jgi:hypothetical protein
MIYFIRMADTECVRVGHTSYCVNTRRIILQIGCPFELVLERTLPGGRDEELVLHERIARHRIRGEWYRLSRQEVAELAGPVDETLPTESSSKYLKR